MTPIFHRARDDSLRERSRLGVGWPDELGGLQMFGGPFRLSSAVREEGNGRPVPKSQGAHDASALCDATSKWTSKP